MLRVVDGCDRATGHPSSRPLATRYGGDSDGGTSDALLILLPASLQRRLLARDKARHRAAYAQQTGKDPDKLSSDRRITSPDMLTQRELFDMVMLADTDDPIALDGDERQDADAESRSYHDFISAEGERSRQEVGWVPLVGCALLLFVVLLLERTYSSASPNPVSQLHRPLAPCLHSPSARD